MRGTIVRSHSGPRDTPRNPSGMLEDLIRFFREGGEKVADYGRNADPLTKMLLGQDPDTQMALRRGLIKGARALPEFMGREGAIRMAASPQARQAMQFVPGLTAAAGALAIGDTILGDESAGNKTMDAAALMAGSYVGGRAGLLGALAAGTGAKLGSDAIQAVMGGM